MEDFTENVLELKSRLQKKFGTDEELTQVDDSKPILELPNWVLQPYFRKPLPGKKVAEKNIDLPQDCITIEGQNITSKLFIFEVLGKALSNLN